MRKCPTPVGLKLAPNALLEPNTMTLTMKPLISYMTAALAGLVLLTGCKPRNPASDVVAEGVLYSVSYLLEGNAAGGFTRVNHSKAVPGGNGSWNVDAYGQLTRDFLIVTYPQRPSLGPRVIPVHRLLSVQFGDGGLTKVEENKPNP